jgi:S-DNA-T family DNA segregation ATPase FtsK/SpoIIIE
LVKLSVIADRSVEPVDLAIRADTAVTVADLRPAFHALLGLPAGSVIRNAGRPLGDDAMLGSPGLQSGCLLEFGTASDETDPATSELQLRVVSGPDCGQVVPLQQGRQELGRDPAVGLRIADPELSRRHAELQVDRREITVRDLGSTNGTYLDGVPIGGSGRPLTIDRPVLMGNSVFTVVDRCEPAAMVMPHASGELLVRRPPSVVEPAPTSVLELPAPLDAGTRPRMHWVAALLPAVASALLALLMRSPQFLAFALLTPLTVLATAISDRRDWRRGSRARRRAHGETAQAAQEECSRLLDQEAARRRRWFPDAPAVLQAAQLPDCRLWERRPGQPQFLAVRLGRADQAAELSVVRAGTVIPQRIQAMPATVDLGRHCLGIAGPTRLGRATARWLLGQLLTLHSPSDLQLIALVDGSDPDWRWLRWAEPALQRVATDRSEWQQVLAELSRLVHDRTTAGRSVGSDWSGQWLVILIDPTAEATELAGLSIVLSAGPAVGITVICVGTDLRMLPAACSATACITDHAGTKIAIIEPGRSPLVAITEGVSIGWAEQLTRRLAPLRDAGTDPTDLLPDRIGLAQLLGFTSIDSAAVRARWHQQRGRPVAPVGLTGSATFNVDLVRDGPHLLIAGTTGSGKSELLRTLVAGLAASSAPDQLCFVLIDYKGGAAFAECAQLPHIQGLVTDLDGYQTRRALTCLDAELRRRETAFARAGVADLAAYQATAEGSRCPIARLVLVIDEFAALAEELPDFLTGMLSIAQRGRSLGVHLVLATQRPAGVVSLDIKANMSLRIALRVTDPAESGDIIGDEAASRISRDSPGRAFARLNAGELVEFQTALVGLPMMPAEQLTLTPLDDWNRIPTMEPAQHQLPSELQLLSEAIARAAVEQGCRRLSPPWLPALPIRLTVAELEAAGNRYQIPFGLTDDPDRQRQYVAQLDLAAGESLGFIGGPRSGRTTSLRTVIGQATSRLTCDELNLYVLDCAGRGFTAVAELPHCGGVVESDDPASMARLISRLRTEIADRQRVFAERGVDTLAGLRESGDSLPAILLVIDGWEGLSALSEDYDAGQSADTVSQLLRDGPSVGLTVLLAGDRAALGVRIGSGLDRKLVLPLIERSDYALAGISASMLPAELLAGRAVSTDDGLQTQLALLTEDQSASAQLNAIRHGALPAPVGAAGPRLRVRRLPELVRLAEIPTSRMPTDLCLLGLGDDAAVPIHSGLFATHSRFLIVGPARSGRSNAAVLVADQARHAGYRVLVAAPTRSPLSDWGRQHADWLLAPDDEAEPDGLGCALDQIELIVLDDIEQFADAKLDQFLLDLVLRHPAAVIGCARSDDLLVSFRGVAVELRRHRNGLLLQPAPADGELLGVRLGLHRAAQLPGRGLLVTDQVRRTHPSGQPLQVALWS